MYLFYTDMRLIIVFFVMPESSLACMEKMILLLLGCAVQCDQKEGYINNIKSLDLHVQQAMVTYIQEV